MCDLVGPPAPKRPRPSAEGAGLGVPSTSGEGAGHNTKNVSRFQVLQLPMFPRRLRKSPSSLLEMCEKAVVRSITRLVNNDRHFHRFNAKLARIIRKTLPADIQTRIIERLLPTSTTEDNKWKFQCLEQDRENISCRAHVECRLAYNFCHRVLRLLFNPQIQSLSVDLRRVRFYQANLYEKVMLEISKVFTSKTARNLTRLHIKGGSVHSDELYPLVSDLCDSLSRLAPVLQDLHLPVCSNSAMESVSKMKSLIKFRSDRTKHFNRQGLFQLCCTESESVGNLKELHLGVFKHHQFKKQDACRFFVAMKNLRSFSLMEENRALIKIGNMYGGFGDKVFTYSIIRLGIINAEFTESEPKDFACQLNEIKIVDRRLKPKYILQACPELSNLYIDWQEELSYPPFRRYEVDWFTKLLLDNSWKELCQKLHSLEIVFPGYYGPNYYSLPLSDFSRLMNHTMNLGRLHLSGAGKQSPIPLHHLLRQCPNLNELVLDKTSIHVPDNYEVIDDKCVQKTLKVFRFLGDMSSLLVNGYLTTFIANYMPLLKELEVQPPSALGYSGMTNLQVRELTKLAHLEKLSLPLSIRDCMMNMPEVIYVLREFECLRYLVISWGKWCEAYDMSSKKIVGLMNWLFNALGAENANIHLQLSYKLHPQFFSK